MRLRAHECACVYIGNRKPRLSPLAAFHLTLGLLRHIRSNSWCGLGEFKFACDLWLALVCACVFACRCISVELLYQPAAHSSQIALLITLAAVDAPQTACQTESCYSQSKSLQRRCSRQLGTIKSTSFSHASFHTEIWVFTDWCVVVGISSESFIKQIPYIVVKCKKKKVVNILESTSYR